MTEDSPTMPFDPRTLDVEGDVTLIVAQRSGTNLKGHRLAMHADVAADVRGICRDTLAVLLARTPVPFADDLAFDAQHQYMLASPQALVAHRLASGRGRTKAEASAPPPDMIEMDPSARHVLDDASSLPDLDASHLGNKTFVFYAAVVGNDPDKRVAFIDKWNPYRAGLSGKLMTFFGDRLRRIEGPLLVFEREFDLVVSEGHIAVLDARAFEAVFRDIDSMKERVPVWSDAAVGSLPVDAGSADLIRSVAEKNARVAKQIRGLFERGAFTRKFETPILREEMQRQGLDVDRLVVGNKLALEEADIPLVLKLIDEKLYVGWHTATPWDVATRSKRQT
jgi:hypothetical protein